MSGGLSGMTRSLATVKATGFDIDILSELGLNREEKIFKSRTKALTDPKTYASDREKMFAEMKAEVQKTYSMTKDSLAGSGLRQVDIQKLAISAADNTYATLNAIMETEFPSGSTELNIQTEAKDKFPGMVSAPTAPAAAPRRHAAPRKKAAAKKKK